MSDRRCLDNPCLVHRATALLAWAAALALGCGTEIVRPDEPLTVTEVTPARGTLAGDGALEIIGTGFSDVVRITVGDAEVPYFIVRSPTRVTALVPRATTPGAADVVVTSQRHGSATCTACFRYYDPAWTVTAISPDTGALDGGMPVTITGTGLDEVVAVTIGAAPLDSVTVVSPTQITGVTPAQAEPGVRDVVVTSAQTGERTCHGCFTYQLDVIAQPVAAAGEHTCALAGDGGAYCWGSNIAGALGDGSTVYSSDTPVAVAGGQTYRAVALGEYHSCALTPGGVAYCWGYNPAGNLGDGSTVSSNVPVPVAGNLTFSVLAPGHDGYYTCGITRLGAAYCWGSNFDGNLGTGGSYVSLRESNIPFPVAGGHIFRAITGGGHHVCALTASGTGYCWGRNRVGPVGDGTTEQRSTPTAIAGNLTFSLIAAGSSQTCGFATSGTTYCWGLGLTDYATTPVALFDNLDFRVLVAGYLHMCGVDTSGVTYCLGSNGAGRLGNGTAVSSDIPVAVSGNLTFTALAGGRSHTCGRTTSGALYCWGGNSRGQLGNGTTESSLVPVPVLPFGTSPAR